MPCPCANITTVGAVISAMPYLTALPKGEVNTQLHGRLFSYILLKTLSDTHPMLIP